MVDLRARLAAAGIRDCGQPDDSAALADVDVVVVWADRALEPDLATALADPAVRVLLAGPTLTRADPDGTLSDAAGLRLGPSSPMHDVRLRMGPDGQRLYSAFHVHGDHAHHDEHEHLTGQVATVEGIADDVRVLRTARLGLTDHPVLTWRPSTATAAWTMGTTPAAIADRDAARLLVQVLREMAEEPVPAPVRVGLLGYGAIGHEHSRAVRAVDGLALAAVCDTSQERLDLAEAAAPGVATTTSAEVLLDRDDVDLVVVSTPPSSHAALGASRDSPPASTWSWRSRSPSAPLRPTRSSPQRAMPGCSPWSTRTGGSTRTTSRSVAIIDRGDIGRGLPRRDVRRRLRAPVQPVALRRGGVGRGVLRLGLARARPGARPGPHSDRARHRRRPTSAAGST